MINLKITQFNSKGYNNKTFWQKYTFIDTITGSHTQNVNSLYNEVKIKIKKQKNLKTCLELLY